MNTDILQSGNRSQTRILATNAVVRNTYLLLAMTLLFMSCLLVGLIIGSNCYWFINAHAPWPVGEA